MYDMFAAITRLRRQYHHGIHTCNPCPGCPATAVGASLCAACIADEMIANGAPSEYVTRLQVLFTQRRNLEKLIDDAIEHIRDHAEEQHHG